MVLLLYSKIMDGLSPMVPSNVLCSIKICSTSSNEKLAKSITLTITSRYNHFNFSSTNSNTSYNDITRQKLQSTISFSLNERDFPLLSIVCQHILSNVSESRLYQRKPARNVKLVGVLASTVYTSSVGELVKPLNISKPVCSSKATKRNVCNAIRVSKLTIPLNVSKIACSNNTTRRNACKVSSVNQLVKLLTVSKSVLSINVLMSITSAVSANLSKYLMLLNLSVPLMELILSFVIPLVSLFVILLVILSQLTCS